MGLDKRRHQRRPAPDVGIVNVYRMIEGKRVFLCSSLLHDISESGVGIRTDEELTTGSELRLKNRAVEYDVKVMRCQAEADGFFIGLEFVKQSA